MNDTSNELNTHNGHEFVDLGLPSRTLWATCNVGATSPEQSGLYFAFGETTGFTAEQVEKEERSFDFGSYDASSISADLTLEQDAAYSYMGGKWRMPTKAESQELLDNCDVTWVSSYMGKGVAGMLFTSRANGNSVFFPAAGYCSNSFVRNVGSWGYYWSASWDSSSFAWYFYFNSGYQNLHNFYGYYGFSVRGVCKR